ncbi:MAG: class I SAM-dependent methyltransferase [Gaiellaceae bacterium]
MQGPHAAAAAAPSSRSRSTSRGSIPSSPTPLRAWTWGRPESSRSKPRGRRRPLDPPQAVPERWLGAACPGPYASRNVEPVAEMRAAIERALPRVPVYAGTAEAIPLGAESVDAVTVGQAFHWFRADEALAEIHRVLRPGGGLGLAWNLRDESVPWVARLTEIMEPHRGVAPTHRTGAWRAALERTTLFGPLGHVEVRHVHRLTPEAVVARVASVSFVAALREPERRRLLGEVRELLASDPKTRGRAEVELPYRTDVYWAKRA